MLFVVYSSASHPVDTDSLRVSKYKTWENEFDEALNRIEYPVKWGDICKFAKRTNISINVYCYNEGNIAPLEITKREKTNKLIYCTLKIKTIVVVYKIWRN